MTYDDLLKYIEEQDIHTGREHHSIFLCKATANRLIADAVDQMVPVAKDCNSVKDVKAYALVGDVLVFTSPDAWFDFKFYQTLNEAE